MSKHKPKHKRKRPGGHHAPGGSTDEKIIAELQQRLAELEATDASQAGAIWGATHKLLLKTACPPAAISRIIVARDSAALAALVGAVARGEAESIDSPQQPTAVSFDIPHETLKMAMRAFRKRLKLTRLDHESKLGVGPMTSGRKADVDAILPPHEYSTQVWEALVAEGQLKAAGQGFYALAEE
ncbi:MAG: hypothetical protein V3T84_05415 [Phycisphaerales bacterium]